MVNIDFPMPSIENVYNLQKKVKGGLGELLFLFIFHLGSLRIMISEVKYDVNGLDFLLRCEQIDGKIVFYEGQAKFHSNISKRKNKNIYEIKHDTTWNEVAKNLERKTENFLLLGIVYNWTDNRFEFFYITKKQMIGWNLIIDKTSIGINRHLLKQLKQYQSLTVLINRMEQGLQLEVMNV